MKNQNYKKQLQRIGHVRGKRPLMPTKVHDKNFHNRKNQLHFRDVMDDELDDLRRQGIKVG